MTSGHSWKITINQYLSSFTPETIQFVWEPSKSFRHLKINFYFHLHPVFPIRSSAYCLTASYYYQAPAHNPTSVHHPVSAHHLALAHYSHHPACHKLNPPSIQLLPAIQLLATIQFMFIIYHLPLSASCLLLLRPGLLLLFLLDCACGSRWSEGNGGGKLARECRGSAYYC